MSKSDARRVAPTLDIHGAFVRRANLGGTLLHDANLIGADATNANFRGSDFKGARLRGTILRGADLTDAKNLTLERISEAEIDDRTILPTYIDRAKLDQLTAANSK